MDGGKREGNVLRDDFEPSTVKNDIFSYLGGTVYPNCTVKNAIFSYLRVFWGRIVQSKTAKSQIRLKW